MLEGVVFLGTYGICNFTYIHVQIILTIWSSFNCYEVLHMIILVSVYSLYMYSGQTLELQDSRKEKEKEVTCMVTGMKLA